MSFVRCREGNVFLDNEGTWIRSLDFLKEFNSLGPRAEITRNDFEERILVSPVNRDSGMGERKLLDCQF